jgi:RHS repeat-associated protein
MQMHLSSDVQIPDGLLAANALLAENSRQGFETYSGTLHQGFEVAISSTSLGIPGTLYDGHVRSRYTGKLRDTDTSLDDFGARDYSSVMGRFLTPDWSADPEPVPYAKLDNPQSLNLYAYVNNNPVSNRDPDGHTHRECTTSFNPTYRTGPGGDSQVFYVLQENCQFVPDQQTLLQRLQNWRTSFVNGWNQRIADHAPPPQSQNSDQMLQDINNIMMGLTPYYRGGSSLKFRPNDVKVDPNTGLVQPGRGISVNTDPSGLEKFGGAKQIESVPPELEVIQRGKNPTHYEIAPREPMPPARFQELLDQIKMR